jgi:outer membrane receptor for ferrienterochelin and colicins
MIHRLAAALFLVPSLAAAQMARLQVRVESEGHPIAQAQVMTGIDITATNALGIARLTLGPGTHVVRVRLIGFKPDSFRVTLARGADTTVMVELHPAAEELEQMFVTSTRGVKRLEDEPVRIEVLGGDDVAEKTEMRPQDLKGFLAEMAGVRMQSTSAATGAAGVRLQGLKPRYSLILADGLPLYGNGGIGLDLLQMPPADLQQIEVIKGPASALYGSNALAGTINLISKRPGNESDFLLHGTSESGGNAFGWTSKKVSERFGYTTVVGAHYQDPRDGDGDTWKELPEVHRVELRPRFFFESPGGGSAFLTLGATSERRNGGFVNDLAPDGSFYSERAKTQRGDVGLSVNRVTGASSVVQLRGSYNLNAVDHRFFDEVENSHRSTGFGELSYSFTDQYNQFLAGAAFDADIAKVKGPSASSANGTPIDYAYLTPALFLQNAFNVNDRLSVTATARGDMHSQYGTFFSPRLSMLLKPVEDWSVRLSATHGFYAPTPFIEEVDPVGAHRVNGFESGAPRAVGAETADYGSADVHGTVGPFELNGTLFGTVLHHPVVTIPASGGRYTLANSEFSHSARGLELFGVYDFEPLFITALYTYTDARERSSIASKVEMAAPYAPRHTGGVDITWEDGKRGTWIALESFYTSRQLLTDDPALAVSKPYAITGILFSQKVRHFKLFANIENLGDVRQTNYAPVVLPSRATDGRWTVTPWAPLEGRTFSVGVRVHGGGE